jgi:hypothetical protein
MGINAEYKLDKLDEAIPENIKTALLSIKELEAELAKDLDN